MQNTIKVFIFKLNCDIIAHTNIIAPDFKKGN